MNSLLQLFPATSNTCFFLFIQQGDLQAPNHQPTGIPSCWKFHKAKFPREFQQRCSGSQNPISSLAPRKSPAADQLPTCYAPRHSSSAAVLFSSVSMPVHCRVILGSLERMVQMRAGLGRKHHHVHSHHHTIHFYSTLWLLIVFMNVTEQVQNY